jgi:hypothetical protein
MRGLLVAGWLAAAASGASAQGVGLALDPQRLIVAVNGGDEKTVAFTVVAPAGIDGGRGRIVITPPDWSLDVQGNVKYVEPGTVDHSASSWIAFSPSEVTIASNERRLVRVTVKVPPRTEPGEYRTALFIQERAPAAPPKPGERNFTLRLRYVFTLYVHVLPVASRTELENVEWTMTGSRLRFRYLLRNSGTAHSRPLVRWVIKDPHGDIVSSGNRDATVLLPGATLQEGFAAYDFKTSGRYEIAVVVDFRDGQPLQSITRPIDIQTSPP